MTIAIQSMTAADYPEAYALWKATEGMGLSEADSSAGIRLFLERNPGLSLVARRAGTLIATVLCGHDGRRGYLHHLAVIPAERGHGLGRRLVDLCLTRLADLGIPRCHILLHGENETGAAFWKRIGWKERTELKLMSHDTRADKE